MYSQSPVAPSIDYRTCTIVQEQRSDESPPFVDRDDSPCSQHTYTEKEREMHTYTVATLSHAVASIEDVIVEPANLSLSLSLVFFFLSTLRHRRRYPLPRQERIRDRRKRLSAPAGLPAES